jgi:hypothetical protein
MKFPPSHLNPEFQGLGSGMRRHSGGFQHHMIGVVNVLLEFFESFALAEDTGNLP